MRKHRLLPAIAAAYLAAFPLHSLAAEDDTMSALSGIPASLVTETPAEGYALAIKLSRVAVKATQPDVEILKSRRDNYADSADGLIAVSQVVAIHFQTIAAANDYWR